MNVIIAAAHLARRAHEGQKRKYTGRPYVEHPARVAARVALHPSATEVMVATAFLHDVLEDTQATQGDILVGTCQDVLDDVIWLTNPSKAHKNLLRAEKKAMDREHLAGAPRRIKIIKLIDRIDNLLEMTGAPWEFKAMYAQESLLLSEAIGDADEDLRREMVNLAAARKAEAALPSSAAL